MTINYKLLLKKFIDHSHYDATTINLYGLDYSLKNSDFIEEEREEILRLFDETEEEIINETSSQLHFGKQRFVG